MHLWVFFFPLVPPRFFLFPVCCIISIVVVVVIVVSAVFFFLACWAASSMDDVVHLQVVVNWGGWSWHGSPLQVAAPLDWVAGMLCVVVDGSWWWRCGGNVGYGSLIEHGSHCLFWVTWLGPSDIGTWFLIWVTYLCPDGSAVKCVMVSHVSGFESLLCNIFLQSLTTGNGICADSYRTPISNILVGIRPTEILIRLTRTGLGQKLLGPCHFMSIWLANNSIGIWPDS